MRLIDIHTHSLKSDGNLNIVDAGTQPIADTPCSIGIHPWKIDDSWEESFNTITELSANRNVVAIGECGFDLIKSNASEELQYKIFIAHAELAEYRKKPLIIHLVKAQHLLMKAAKEFPHTQAWIIHGFRGKPEQATRLLATGIFISLGALFNNETARIIPPDRLFIESDESTETLYDIYNRIATARGCSIRELVQTITANTLRYYLNGREAVL